ncbi:MAG: DUF6775 family putative metallopeptidase [bacterium]
MEMLYQIYLYNEISDLELAQVISCLKEYCSFAGLEVRESFIAHFYSDKLVRGLADCRLTGPGEKEAAYHGGNLGELFQAQIPQHESSINQLHLIMTPRLVLTRDEKKGRYHARTLLGGQPSIVSSSGMVEGPARSVEFYAFEAGYKMLGQEIPDGVFKKRFAGEFLEYHDPRLTEVIKGYLLQAVAYRFFGEGFCADPACRLFNAHYQSEMLQAQLKKPEFCARHKRLFWRKEFFI